MPASKAEQVLEGLRAVLETVPGAKVQRNSVPPEKIPAGGLIILRNGDPGERSRRSAGSGARCYQHAVEIEVYVEEGPCGGPRRCFRRSPPAPGLARSRPDARQIRLRPDLRQARGLD
jgi:hypothetical protein